MSPTTDVDWVVIGSGFGGSVAALRLAQKGYSVRVLESGSRFRDQDFAHSTWDARRYFFAPRLGLRGIMRITDGSALPANPGVNPSLTITALAEHTIAQLPATPAARHGHAPGSRPETQTRRGWGR